MTLGATNNQTQKLNAVIIIVFLKEIANAFVAGNNMDLQCTVGWANEIEMGEVLVRGKGDHRILPRGGHWGPLGPLPRS